MLAIALIIAVAGVAVLLRDGSGGGEAAGTGDEGSTLVPNAYTVLDDPCIAIDLSPAEDLAGTANILYDNGDEMFSIWTWSCKYSMRNDDVWGNLDITIHVYPDTEGAEREFDQSLHVTRNFFDRVDDALGPWQQGRTFIKDDSDEFVGSLTVMNWVQDGNFAVEVRFHCIIDPGVDLESELRSTVEAVVVNVMTAHAV